MIDMKQAVKLAADSIYEMNQEAGSETAAFLVEEVSSSSTENTWEVTISFLYKTGQQQIAELFGAQDRGRRQFRTVRLSKDNGELLQMTAPEWARK
ncbi:MAG: hypothetical protein AAF823_11020 [Planctomycetota bacterium]